MKKLILIVMLLCMTGCTIKSGDEANSSVATTNQYKETAESTITSEYGKESLGEEDEHFEESTESFTEETESLWTPIDPSGNTLESRINVPKGYARTACGERSLTAFLRGYTMKEDGAPVLLYNGAKKSNQRAHVAVFQLPIENADLQQCADSVMRIYGEYCLSIGRPERIKYHFTNGFLTEYRKWRDGYRIKVDGNNVYWVESGGYDDSYASFQAYMRMVFSYAGTLSMDTYEANSITLNELQVGDVFLKGGSPGHVVMVVDICENESGKKAFLLGQGYMPAQEFHVINNPAHLDDPWYYEDEVSYPFRTAEYTFPEGSLKRVSYSEWISNH